MCVCVCEFLVNVLVMTCLATGNSPLVTSGTDCIWVEERKEEGGVLGCVVGGEDLDAGEQEDRSPMATGTFCQIQVSKLQRDTRGGGEMVFNRNNQRD